MIGVSHCASARPYSVTFFTLLRASQLDEDQGDEVPIFLFGTCHRLHHFFYRLRSHLSFPSTDADVKVRRAATQFVIEDSFNDEGDMKSSEQADLLQLLNIFD